MIWVPPTASQLIASSREAIETQSDQAIEWQRTPDGAWTSAIGVYSARMAQGFALALSARSVESADPTGLAALAAERGVPRTGATATRILVEVTGTGSVRPTDVVVGFGASEDVRWSVVEVYQPGTTPPVQTPPSGDGSTPIESGTLLVLEAQTPGRIVLPSGASGAIGFEPTKSGVTLAYGGPADILFRGSDQESIPQLRARLAALQSLPLGSAPGLDAAIRSIAGISAVSLAVESPGTVRIGVAGSIGQGDLVDVAETIYQRIAFGIVTVGSEFARIRGADGRETTVLLDLAVTEEVDIAIVLTVAPGVDADSIAETAESAVREIFSTLQAGDELLWFPTLAALRVPGVRRATLTLNEATNDIVPASANALLIPVFTSITVEVDV